MRGYADSHHSYGLGSPAGFRGTRPVNDSPIRIRTWSEPDKVLGIVIGTVPRWAIEFRGPGDVWVPVPVVVGAPTEKSSPEPTQTRIRGI